MSDIGKHPHHKTHQFRNVVQHMRKSSQYKGWDNNKKGSIMDTTVEAPTVSYIGTVKLHGTFGGIVLHEDQTISFHSKSQLLGFVDSSGDFTLNSDNAEFAQSMWRRFKGVVKTIGWAVESCKAHYGKIIYPIKISGEFCGVGIQKGVGVSYLPKKSFFVFGVKCGDINQDEKEGWLPLSIIRPVKSQEHHIYNIMDFTTERITIDFNSPEESQNVLVEATEEVEKECPVSKALGVTESLLGEGLVWVPEDPQYCYDNGNFFKTKGQKHSVSKVKSVAAVCPEKLNSIKEFVEYAATDNRLEQGVSEVGLDQKLTGQYIGWVNRDINKEEGDVLEENNLTMKDVGKKISDKARKYYLDKLNSEF